MSEEHLSVDGTLGALLVSTFVSCMLFGITTLQLYIYSTRWVNDSKWTKGLAVGIWLMDGLSSALQCHTMYFYLISHYADVSVLEGGVWSLCTMSLMESTISMPVELFYASRIWKLSRDIRLGRVIACVIASLSIIHSSFCFLFSAKILEQSAFAAWGQFFFKWVAITGLTLAAVTDVLIALAMAYLLRSFKTTISSSKALVNNIIFRSVETGTITSIGVISVMVTFVTMQNMISFGLLFLLPKLYSNSMLAMLNTRDSQASTSGYVLDSQEVQYTLETIRFADVDKYNTVKRDLPPFRGASGTPPDV